MCSQPQTISFISDRGQKQSSTFFGARYGSTPIFPQQYMTELFKGTTRYLLVFSCPHFLQTSSCGIWKTELSAIFSCFSSLEPSLSSSVGPCDFLRSLGPFLESPEDFSGQKSHHRLFFGLQSRRIFWQAYACSRSKVRNGPPFWKHTAGRGLRRSYCPPLTQCNFFDWPQASVRCQPIVLTKTKIRLLCRLTACFGNPIF